LGEAQPQAQSALKRVGLFLAMALGTGGLGAALAALSAFMGVRMMRGELPGLTVLGLFLLIVAASHVAGVIIGIVFTHRALHYRGSLWLGVVGSILGAGLAIGLFFLAMNVNLPGTLLFVCLGVGPPLLGTAGFHLRRRRGSTC